MLLIALSQARACAVLFAAISIRLVAIFRILCATFATLSPQRTCAPDLVRSTLSFFASLCLRVGNIFLRHCERSEAIQSMAPLLDCFVIPFLAMTMVDDEVCYVYNTTVYR